jgi:hypothetical protein
VSWSDALKNLPTLAELNARPRAEQKGKGAEPSRLQVKTAKAKDESKAEAKWKAAIWKRDDGKCRWCRRAVRKCLELVADRGECHHVSGRVVREIRWDVRNGALFCASCHERLTGTVGEKHLITSKHTFSADGIAYINADKPFRYQRVA